MAGNGFVVLRYTSPRLPEGIYNEFVRRTTDMANREVWPAARAAGATSWKILADVLQNTPVNTEIIEFDTVDQALAYLVSPSFMESLAKFRSMGALDMSVTACRLRDEGYL